MNKKQLLDVRNIIIVVLILISILEFMNPKNIMPNRIKLVPQIDSIPYAVHDTVVVDSPYEIEVPVEIKVPYEVRVEVPVEKPIDTNAILNSIGNKVFKKDVLKLPNNIGTVTIFDTLSNSRILGRSFKSDVKQKIVKDTIYTPTPKKNEVYFGVDGSFNKIDVVNYLGSGFLWKTKNDEIFHLGVGVANRVTDGTNGKFYPYLSGGVYWKIRIKKKE
jgi:hypothetical protein